MRFGAAGIVTLPLSASNTRVAPDDAADPDEPQPEIVRTSAVAAADASAAAIRRDLRGDMVDSFVHRIGAPPEQRQRELG
nr:hypothetical protein GCM10010200_015890 [Actinomadura rugatobispora]